MDDQSLLISGKYQSKEYSFNIINTVPRIISPRLWWSSWVLIIVKFFQDISCSILGVWCPVPSRIHFVLSYSFRVWNSNEAWSALRLFSFLEDWNPSRTKSKIISLLSQNHFFSNQKWFNFVQQRLKLRQNKKQLQSKWPRKEPTRKRKKNIKVEKKKKYWKMIKIIKQAKTKIIKVESL